MSKKTLTGLAFAFLLPLATPAYAIPVDATVACVDDNCVITPDGGPVALNPLNFDLQVNWNSQQLELTEPDDDRGEWNIDLLFDVTGSVSDVFETVASDALTLVDENGLAIAGLNGGFDDVTSFNPILRVNFEFFGPDTQSLFLVHGFNLAMTSMEALIGSFDSFAFREARLTTGMGSAALTVSEPANVALLAMVFTAMLLLRRRRLCLKAV